MPSRNHCSNKNLVIDKAFQSKNFDDLLNQPTEQFTLAACSSILRNVNLRLKDRRNQWGQTNGNQWGQTRLIKK